MANLKADDDLRKVISKFYTKMCQNYITLHSDSDKSLDDLNRHFNKPEYSNLFSLFEDKYIFDNFPISTFGNHMGNNKLPSLLLFSNDSDLVKYRIYTEILFSVKEESIPKIVLIDKDKVIEDKKLVEPTLSDIECFKTYNYEIMSILKQLYEKDDNKNFISYTCSINSCSFLIKNNLEHSNFTEKRLSSEYQIYRNYMNFANLKNIFYTLANIPNKEVPKETNKFITDFLGILIKMVDDNYNSKLTQYLDIHISNLQREDCPDMLDLFNELKKITTRNKTYIKELESIDIFYKLW